VGSGEVNQMQTTLILDELSVAEHRGVEFHLNPARKHAENPVLIPGPAHAWDGLQVCWPTRILYDAEEGLFRCLYHAVSALQYDVNQYPERAGFARWLGRMWQAGYAQSEDGVHWEKPDLPFHRHLDQPTNRVSIEIRPGVEAGSGKGWQDYSAPQAFWQNTAPEDKSERFLAMFTEIGADEAGERTFKHFQKVVYASADGKAWKRKFTAYDASSPDGNPAPNVLDIYSVIHDPSAADPSRRVMAYGQTDRPANRTGVGNRGLGLVAGSTLDSLRYDDLQMLLEADDEYPEEIHFGDVRRLQNGYTVCVHDYAHIPHQTLESPYADIRLAVSEDGVAFRRVHGHSPLVARGRRSEFDSNQLVTAALVEYGDELFIYYQGTACYYRPWPSPPEGIPYALRANTVYPICLGLATLPRDRFAFASAAPGCEGVLTTHRCLGGVEAGVWLNADGDALSVKALNDSGKELAHGHLGDLRSQMVYRNVQWDAAPPSGLVRLRITMADGARLYSIRVGN
jgi:hypothetical protein